MIQNVADYKDFEITEVLYYGDVRLQACQIIKILHIPHYSGLPLFLLAPVLSLDVGCRVRVYGWTLH